MAITGLWSMLRRFSPALHDPPLPAQCSDAEGRRLGGRVEFPHSNGVQARSAALQWSWLGQNKIQIPQHSACSSTEDAFKHCTKDNNLTGSQKFISTTDFQKAAYSTGDSCPTHKNIGVESLGSVSGHIRPSLNW